MISKRFGVQLAASGLVIVLGAWGVAQAQRDSETPDPTAWETEPHPANEPPMPIAADDAVAVPEPDEATVERQEDGAADPPGPTTGFASLAIAESAESEDSFTASGVRQVAHEDHQAAPEDHWALPPQQLGGVSQDDDDGLDDRYAAAAGPAYVSSPSAVSGPAVAAEDAATAAPGFALPTDSMAASSGLELPASSQPSPAESSADQAAAVDPSAYDPASLSVPSISQSDDADFGDDLTPADVTSEQSRGDSADALPTLQFAGGPVNELRAAPIPAAETANVADSGPPSDPYQPSEDPSPYPFADPSDFAEQGAVDQGSVDQGAADQGAVAAAAMPRPDPTSGPAMIVASSLDDSPSQGSFDSSVPAPAASLDTTMTARSTDQPDRDAPIAAIASDDESVLNEPGDRRLDGMQAPSIVIHKRAPDQVKVGKPTTFTILVQNVGGVEAMGVQVHDRIPAGMRLLDATPQPQRHDDLLLWSLGALEPGGERTVSMQLVPEQEGELGSVARVTFEAAASVRTISTRPALKVVQRSPQQVLIGQQVEIEIEVSNPGTGEATGVILQTDVPDGLEHPKGRQLDNLIGTLAPGEVRRQVLRLRAVAAGSITNEIRITADDGLEAADSAAVEVIAPQLAVELEGPSRRFLERQATYHINLANVGSAEATNVEIVAYLDRGFSFVGTEYQGQYDPSRHAVYWSLAELPADARGAVPLTLLPIEQGERAIRLEARGDLNLVARHEKRVNVDALAELTFSVTDDVDPIEVGGTVTYEIKLVNRGSGDDSDVKLQLQLPAGLELISSESDAATDGNGLVVFTPQAEMAARSEVIHRVRVKGVSPGTHVVKAIVSSNESPVEVTKEESTTVYADE